MIVRTISCLLILINFYGFVYADQADSPKTTKYHSKNALKLYLSLQLVALKANKTSENVDELYMAVTAYPSEGRPTHKIIPSIPKYWLSTHLNKIKDLSLWQGVLKEGKNVTIQLSLIEKDLPPFDADDLVGTVVAKVKNINGKLEVEWSMPNKSETLKSVKAENNTTVRQFSLVSKEANYSVKFSFVDLDIKPSMKKVDKKSDK